VSEVAELIGMSERSARDWIKRHALPLNDARPLRVEERAVREQLAREHRTPRRLPEVPGAAPGGKPEAFGGIGEPIEAAYRVAGEAATEVALVPLATMVEELRGLADQLAELARRNEALALEVGQLRERQVGHEGQLGAKDETIATQRAALATNDQALAELRRRAETAEAERDGLTAAQPAPEGATPDTPSPEASAGFWARVRRVLGGATGE